MQVTYQLGRLILAEYLTQLNGGESLYAVVRFYILSWYFTDQNILEHNPVAKFGPKRV
jgi:hypothetical protein